MKHGTRTRTTLTYVHVQEKKRGSMQPGQTTGVRLGSPEGVRGVPWGPLGSVVLEALDRVLDFKMLSNMQVRSYLNRVQDKGPLAM